MVFDSLIPPQGFDPWVGFISAILMLILLSSAIGIIATKFAADALDVMDKNQHRERDPEHRDTQKQLNQTNQTQDITGLLCKHVSQLLYYILGYQGRNREKTPIELIDHLWIYKYNIRIFSEYSYFIVFIRGFHLWLVEL